MDHGNGYNKVEGRGAIRQIQAVSNDRRVGLMFSGNADQVLRASQNRQRKSLGCLGIDQPIGGKDKDFLVDREVFTITATDIETNRAIR